MKKLTIGLSLGAIVATGAAATATTLYAINKNKSDSYIDDKLFDIYEKFKTLPGLDHSTYDSFDEFEDHVFNELEQKDESVKTVISNMLDKEIEIVVNDIKKGNEANDIVKKQLVDHWESITGIVDSLEKGYVGEHDINFYKELINEKASQSILDSTVAEMNLNLSSVFDEISDLKSETAASTSGINSKITDLNASLAEFKNGYDSFKISSGNTDTLIMNDVKALDAMLKNQDLQHTNSIIGLEKILQNANNDIADNIAKLENQSTDIGDLELAVRDLEAISTILSTKATQASADILQIRDSISNLDAATKTSFDNLIAKVDGIETLFNQKIFEYDEKFKGIDSTLSDIEINYNNLEHSVSGFSTSLEQTNNLANTNSLTLNEVTAQISQINTAVTTLEAEKLTMESAIQANKDQLELYGSGLVATENSIASIFNSLDDIIANVDSAESRILNLEDIVSQLNNQQSADISKVLFATNRRSWSAFEKVVYLSENLSNFTSLHIVLTPSMDGNTYDQSLTINIPANVTSGGRTMLVFNSIFVKETLYYFYLNFSSNYMYLSKTLYTNRWGEAWHLSSHSPIYLESIVGVY